MFRRKVGLLTFGIATILGLGTSLYAVSRTENTVRSEPLPSPSLALIAQGNSYPRRPFKFVDDAERHHNFYQFRQQLRQAIKDRNAKFIRSISAHEIKLTLGTPKTWDDLKIDDPKAPAWQEMERVFALGCRTRDQGESWVCPNLFTDWKDELNPTSDIAIVQDNVPVYAQADRTKLTLGLLSKEIVKLDWERQDGSPFIPGWRRIILPDGRLGYVEEQFTYSPMGYRAAFEKQNLNWNLILFLGGD